MSWKCLLCRLFAFTGERASPADYFLLNQLTYDISDSMVFE